VLVPGLIALAVGLALQPVVIAALRRRGVLDLPDSRSSHTVATPRGGGLALVPALVAGAAPVAHGTAAWILVSVVLTAGVGLLEDVIGIPVVPRLLLLSAGVAPIAVAEAAGHRLAVLVALVGFAYAVSVVNAVNFMDGVNGLSASVGVGAGVAYAALAMGHHLPGAVAVGAAVAGASLGFAPYNVPQARVFLGDCGSYGLGAALAGLGIALWLGGLTVEAAAAPLAIYLVDTGTTLLRRVRSGDAWHLPHRTHVYQRLTDLGLSHSQVSGLVLLLVVICAALGAATGLSTGIRVASDLALALVLCGYLVLPTVLGRKATAS
jgi:UDP-N-acetylmuramyl pentapeptide phosphotransferase/UDP-N-acetylglucosamine-1-phosphate transferase